ncbi:heterokaryon incompatibility protein-domain-containing protein [Xylariales sp. PMI_506]|nr:heterokaryon incompatibility protein-domain-containing protein [Xylariales sp. PMI_506]
MFKMPFQYLESLGDASIRLVEILPSSAPSESLVEIHLDTYAIDSLPQYHALSYTWGPPTPELDEYSDEDKVSILVNGEDFKVFPNLCDALRRVREMKQVRYYWIDAICINQEDKPERSAQVAIMDRIYSRAERVDIWLGELTSAKRVAPLITNMAALSDFDHIYKVKKSRDPHLAVNADEWIVQQYDLPSLRDSIWKDVISFFKRRWFNRVWIIQEIALCRDAAVLLGADTLPWADVVNSMLFLRFTGLTSAFLWIEHGKDSMNLLAHYVGQSIVAIDVLHDIYSDGIEDGDTNYGPMIGDVASPQTVAHFLFVALLLSRSSEASDPRDRVYSLLGIVRAIAGTLRLPQLDLQADYSSQTMTHHAFTAAASVIIRDCGHASILGFVNDQGMERLVDLPSWVPDFIHATYNPIHCLLRTQQYPDFDPARDRSLGVRAPKVDGTILHLTGSCVGTVTAIGTAMITSESKPLFNLVECCKIIIQCEQTYTPTGQGRIEALWRTIICDMDDFSHPARHEMADCFKIWIAALIMLDWQESSTELNRSSYLKKFQYLEEFRSDPDSDQLPNIAYLEECGRKMGLLPSDPAPTDNDKSVAHMEMCNKGRLYEEYALMAMPHRRLFLTANGYLGLGPVSVKVGDTVWAASASRTLLVLRDSSASADSSDVASTPTYMCIGEAYVHGAMFGEAISENSEWVDVSLV